MLWHPDDSPLTEQVALEERVQKLATRSLKKESKLKALHLAMSLIDLTTLRKSQTSQC
jgi:deoxyribose-phosphate aldolase